MRMRHYKSNGSVLRFPRNCQTNTWSCVSIDIAWEFAVKTVHVAVWNSLCPETLRTATLGFVTGHVLWSRPAAPISYPHWAMQLSEYSSSHLSLLACGYQLDKVIFTQITGFVCLGAHSYRCCLYGGVKGCCIADYHSVLLSSTTRPPRIYIISLRCLCKG